MAGEHTKIIDGGVKIHPKTNTGWEYKLENSITGGGGGYT